MFMASTGSTQKKVQKRLFENLTSGQQGHNRRQELTSQKKGRLVYDTVEIQTLLQHLLGHYELVKARKKTHYGK